MWHVTSRRLEPVSRAELEGTLPCIKHAPSSLHSSFFPSLSILSFSLLQKGKNDIPMGFPSVPVPKIFAVIEYGFLLCPGRENTSAGPYLSSLFPVLKQKLSRPMAFCSAFLCTAFCSVFLCTRKYVCSHSMCFRKANTLRFMAFSSPFLCSRKRQNRGHVCLFALPPRRQLSHKDAAKKATLLKQVLSRFYGAMFKND